jgi:hypothetical protein
VNDLLERDPEHEPDGNEDLSDEPVAARLGWQANPSGPDLYAWFEMLVPMATGWVAAGLVMSVVVTAVSLRQIRLR